MPYTIEVDDGGHLVWPPRHTDTGKTLMVASQATWQAILKQLAKGPIADKSGRAAPILSKRLRYKFGVGAFSTQLNHMVEAGLITRETRGRRTFNIGLAIDADQLPVEWFPVSTNDHGPENATSHATDAGDATGPVATPDVPPDAVAVENDLRRAEQEHRRVAKPDHFGADHLWPEDEDTGVDYSLLATALLERVVELATGASAVDPDAYDKATVLSVQLTHANGQAEKLRRRVNVLEQELAVSAGVVKTYRVRLSEEERLHRGTEANLQHALSTLRKLDANAKLNEDQRNALAKLLKEIPRSPDTQRNIG